MAETCTYCDNIAFVRMDMRMLDLPDEVFSLYQCQKCHMEFFLWDAERQGKLGEVADLAKGMMGEGN